MTQFKAEGNKTLGNDHWFCKTVLALSPELRELRPRSSSKTANPKEETKPKLPPHLPLPLGQ